MFMAFETLQNEKTLSISSPASFLETSFHTSLTFRKAPNVRKRDKSKRVPPAKPLYLPPENTRIRVLFSRAPGT